MGLDRFITWKDDPAWGSPTIERIAETARDFLGEDWEVSFYGSWITCESKSKQSFHLRSEMPEKSKFAEEMQKHTRGFEVFFPGPTGKTSVITRQADRFTCAVADEFASILAQWWNGEIGD